MSSPIFQFDGSPHLSLSSAVNLSNALKLLRQSDTAMCHVTILVWERDREINPFVCVCAILISEVLFASVHHCIVFDISFDIFNVQSSVCNPPESIQANNFQAISD